MMWVRLASLPLFASAFRLWFSSGVLCLQATITRSFGPSIVTAHLNIPITVFVNLEVSFDSVDWNPVAPCLTVGFGEKTLSLTVCVNS